MKEDNSTECAIQSQVEIKDESGITYYFFGKNEYPIAIVYCFNQSTL